MILYNPHGVTTFLRLKGSVFPHAFKYAICSALLGVILKELDHNGKIDLDEWQFMVNNNVYQGFSFTLGFVVVFRASQSYIRYWQAATAVHQMRAEWFSAAASLVSFAQSSKNSAETVNRFQHVVVRLFTLLHAMAMEEIACILDEEFPLLDIEGFNKHDLKILLDKNVQGRKVEIVCCWIKAHILRNMGNVGKGVLSIPPPILTRVFQELSHGLVKYHDALQVVIWPFPFPYAQMSYLLILCHCIITPIVIAQTTRNTVVCAIVTLLSVVCVKGVDVTAAELENPFGDDANDLPVLEMHQEMVQDMILLINPSCWNVPRVTGSAILEYGGLASACEEHRMSLQQYQKSKLNQTSYTAPIDWLFENIQTDVIAKSVREAKRHLTGRSLEPENVAASQKQAKNHLAVKWSNQDYPDTNNRLQKVLGMDKCPATARDAAVSQETTTLPMPFSLAEDPVFEFERGEHQDANPEHTTIPMPLASSSQFLRASRIPMGIPQPDPGQQPFRATDNEILRQMQGYFDRQDGRIDLLHARQLQVLQALGGTPSTPSTTHPVAYDIDRAAYSALEEARDSPRSRQSTISI